MDVWGSEVAGQAIQSGLIREINRLEDTKVDVSRLLGRPWDRG